jgi:glycosyltransferase involved in cell wall biosynthesis
MAVHNSESTVAAALRSMLDQTRPPDEIVIIDDGSTDGTTRILEQFRSHDILRIVRLSKNRGVAYACNAGLDVCSGEWVARLDADDWWDGNHLETLEALLATTGLNNALIATRARYWGADNRLIGISHGPLNRSALRCFMMHDNPFVHSAVIFHRETALQAGGYPTDTQWEDYGLWIALANHGDALIVDTTTVNYRTHPDSLSSIDKPISLQGRLEMQRRAWRLFRRQCPLAGTIALAATWTRVKLATARYKCSA